MSQIPNYYCRFLDPYNVASVDTGHEWADSNLCATPDKMMAYLTYLLTTFTGAEIVYSASSTDIVFKYRPDANHPYIYLEVVTATNSIRISNIGYTYDETNHAFQTYFAPTGGYKKFSSSYPSAFFIAYPGFFAVMNCNNGQTLSGCANNDYMGCGFMYYPTDHRIPSVTPGVVTTGSGGVLSNVTVVFDRDMSNLVAGDYLYFWPSGSGPIVRGLVASTSGSSVTFTSLSSDVVAGQVGLLFPILILFDGNTTYGSRLLFAYGLSGSIALASFPNISSMMYGDGLCRNSADQAGRYPLIRLRFYNASYGSCQIPTAGFGFFYKSSTQATAALSNDNGSIPQTYVSTVADSFTLTGSWSFPVNSLVGKYVFFLDGVCVSQVRKIIANTATTITWQHPTWGTPGVVNNFMIADDAYVVQASGNLMRPFDVSYFCMKEQY